MGSFWESVLILMTLIILFSGISVYIQPRFMMEYLARKNPDVLFFVTTKEKVVALTIDDVPTPTETPQILDILHEHAVKATFFCIGHNIIHEDPAQATLHRMHEEGHELGNHMFIDEPSYQLSEVEFERQLLDVDRLITTIQPKHSNDTKWFRPGSGFFNNRMLHQVSSHGYRIALGSCYPHDPSIPFSSINSLYILHRVHPGAVIVLHNRPWTLHTLKTIIPQLTSMGYKITTLSDLLTYEQATIPPL